MKKTNVFCSLAVTFVMFVGCIAANASTALAPYGQFENQAWNAKYFYALIGDDGPAVDWYAADFDDTVWGNIEGPISRAEQWDSYPALSFIGTVWQANNASYWVRRHFTVEDFNDYYKFFVIHDDACTAYLNGVQIYNSTSAITSPNYNTVVLQGEALKALKQGDNVLAVYVSDSGGGQALMDFGLYGYDLDDIVTRADVPITISNDATYPWTASGTEAENGNRGKTYSSSSLQMAYSSSVRTELKFDWYKYRYYSSGLDLQLYIDGALVNSTTNGSWNTCRYYLQPGEHVIVFRDSIGSNSYEARSGVRNVSIKEIKPLETAVLTENSQPLTFTNESATPWTIEDGYIEHCNYRVMNLGSKFSTTFDVEKTSKLSFTYKVANFNTTSYNYEECHNLFVKINGIQISKSWNNQSDTYWCVALEPGHYTVEWTDTVYNHWAVDEYNYYTQIKNIELSNNWIDVDLATAGTLGYEVLMSGKADVLTDVEFLKISGPMNASDWTDIRNMTNLVALDLSEAQIMEIGNSAFAGKSSLNSIILPESLTSIGEHAFRSTSLRRISIPTAVTSIGQFAFSATPIQQVSFADDSQLESLGNAAFYNCKSLQTITIPNSVTSMGYSVVQDCSSLKSIVFPNAITFINDYMCSGCSSLEQVQLPSELVRINYAAFNGTGSLKSIDLPSTVKEIRGYAFQNSGIESITLPVSLDYLYSCAFNNCAQLKHIEMPSYLESGDAGYNTRYYWASGTSISYDYGSEGGRYFGYRRNFTNCPAIETVVMRSATPPAITSDPFESSRAKSSITLVVPSFSVVNYKLDTYWYQFGTIIEGDDVDYWKLTSSLMLTNNRRMPGKPDVDLYFGGQLTAGGNAPFPMGQFNYFVNESNPGRLLNTCENMTADSATTKFAVDANKWYFFTPLYDVTIADIDVSNGASYVFRYYDAQNRAANGASGSWKNVDTDKLLGGQGYIFHCNTACTITFPADAAGQAKLFGTTDVTRTLTVNEAESTANRSWNYIGNPFPCYYDIYYMDFTAPITVWNGSTYQAYSIADDEFVLRPMQSFFVQKPDAVDQIIFHKEGRQVTTSIAHGAAARTLAPAASSRKLFDIIIAPTTSSEEIVNGQLVNSKSDQARVVINDEASMGYEIERDAAKFMSFEAGVPQLFTADGEGNSYAINERPIGNGQVSLAYYAGQEGFYTIRALRADGEVLLYDAELNKTIDLTQEGYTFHSETTNGVNSSRFMLTFKVKGGESTGISDNNRETINNNGSVYDLQGRKTTATQKGIYVKDGHKVVKK